MKLPLLIGGATTSKYSLYILYLRYFLYHQICKAGLDTFYSHDDYLWDEVLSSVYLLGQVAIPFTYSLCNVPMFVMTKGLYAIGCLPNMCVSVPLQSSYSCQDSPTIQSTNHSCFRCFQECCSCEFHSLVWYTMPVDSLSYYRLQLCLVRQPSMIL